MNEFNATVDNKWFGGTALAIAYTSDVNSLQPNDMTVISVNQDTVWFRSVGYQIPAGLPPCPAGGCICSWNWIHEANHGEGYPYEIVRSRTFGGLKLMVTVQCPLPLQGDRQHQLGKHGR